MTLTTERQTMKAFFRRAASPVQIKAHRESGQQRTTLSVFRLSLARDQSPRGKALATDDNVTALTFVRHTLIAILMLAGCAHSAIDCGYRPHVRTARDAEARAIDLSRNENVPVADLNDYETIPLPDTARNYAIEDHVVTTHAFIERISRESDGTFILKLRDGNFRVLAYVPGKECSTGSAFESQINAVRAAIGESKLHVGDLVAVRALVFFDHVTPGGAARGVALTPVLGVSVTNGLTYGLAAVPAP